MKTGNPFRWSFPAPHPKEIAEERKRRLKTFSENMKLQNPVGCVVEEVDNDQE